MKRKSVTFACLSVLICIMVCLQMINHFVMMNEGKSECPCSCKATPKEVVESPNYSAEKEKKVSEIFNQVLEILGNMEPDKQASIARSYEQLLNVFSKVTESRSEVTKGGRLRDEIVAPRVDEHTDITVQVSEEQEICPEKFMGKSLTYGYPFFRNGFATLNCSQHVPLHKLVTLVFDDLHTVNLNPPAYERVMKGLKKFYPKMKALYITSNKSMGGTIKMMDGNVEMINVKKDMKLGEAWSNALPNVSTKYVLIAPHLVEFDDDVNLNRLIRILNHNPDVAVVSGAFKTRKGFWDIGCQQSRMLNYTLTLQGGYYTSFSECVVCDFTPGPWLVRTVELVQLEFDRRLDFGVFHDIFWRLREQKRISVSCPDVMFNIDQPEVEDGRYLGFARKYEIRKIVEPSGRVRWYGCRRGVQHRNTHSCFKPRGIAVPPCDLENLADAIKLIMSECEKAGLFCELQEGTLLGAVKLNKVLPWERDADLTFLTANYSALKALGPLFEDAGYDFTAHDHTIWCCVDGRTAGGKFSMVADGWNIELYGQHLLESEMLVARGEKPTKIDFAGQMVTVMRNPGLFARNRYGKMLYRHQEHWLDRGKTSGWHFYNPGVFEECPREGHSGCLSQFSTDGNLQFDVNACPCTL